MCAPHPFPFQMHRLRRPVVTRERVNQHTHTRSRSTVARVKSSLTLGGVASIAWFFSSFCVQQDSDRKHNLPLCGVERTMTQFPANTWMSWRYTSGAARTCAVRPIKSATRSRGGAMTPSPASRTPSAADFVLVSEMQRSIPHVQHGLNFGKISGKAAEVVPMLQFRLSNAIQVHGNQALGVRY